MLEPHATFTSVSVWYRTSTCSQTDDESRFARFHLTHELIITMASALHTRKAAPRGAVTAFLVVCVCVLSSLLRCFNVVWGANVSWQCLLHTADIYQLLVK